MSLKNNVILITLIRLIAATLMSALVTLLFPFLVLGLGIYLKRKRGLKLSEVFAESPYLYNFFIVNIYPICFQVLPELFFVMDQGKREQRQWKRKKPPVYESKLDLSLLKVGDVILTGQESWSAGLPIQASNILSNSVTERFWTHAAIYAGNGRVVEAQADGRGVTNSDLETFYFKKGSRLRVLRHCYLTPELLQEIVNYCQKRVDSGCAYDTWGVSFYALAALMPPMTSGWLEQPFAEKFFNVSDSYFCSELVAEAFLSNGYDIFRRRPWRVKPLDFACSPLFLEVDCSYSRWAVEPMPPAGAMVA